MTERITPAMVTASTLNDLNSSLTALERTSDELSSGKTILEPSDNPYGASRVIDLQSQLDGLRPTKPTPRTGSPGRTPPAAPCRASTRPRSGCAN